MKYFAKVQTRFEALHCYPGAPRAVSYLQHPHRHMFHVTVWIQQFHTERDIEYFMTKALIDQFLKLRDFTITSSCEQIAEAIIDYTSSVVNDLSQPRPRVIRCEVLEDGENGALVEL